jgi:hypothetical protein
MRRFAQHFAISEKTTVLDMGGYPAVWELLDVRPRITILNLAFTPADREKGMECVVGDGCNTTLVDRSFDVVFSNSVIEHVGDLERQRQFARECMRCGWGYYVQTPNKWFPVDPHTLLPFAHWLPKRAFNALMKISPRFLIARPSPAEMEDLVNMRLLSKSDLQELFPGAEIIEERFLGITKSLIAVSKKQKHLQGRG